MDPVSNCDVLAIQAYLYANAAGKCVMLSRLHERWAFANQALRLAA